MTGRAIPRAELRQIDRLAARAHWFHRFAHHPLCDAYRDEMFRFGRRTRLCKGCALGLLGAVTGTPAALATPAAAARLAAPLIAVVLVGALGLASLAIWATRGRTPARSAVSQGPKGGPDLTALETRATDDRCGASVVRTSKWMTRFAPCAVLSYSWCGATLFGVVNHRWYIAILASASAVLIAALLRSSYQRRGPDRRACEACPKRAAQSICPGWAPIVQRERAFRRRSGAMLEAAMRKLAAPR